MSVPRTAPDVEKAKLAPESVFDSPMQVVHDAGLSRADKIEILKQWELTARALQRADDESMTGGEPPRLDEVNKALKMLDPEGQVQDGFGKMPTKI